MEIQFSKDQVDAIETIREWRRGPDKLAVLGGLAGTGKTTVTAWLIENVFQDDGTAVACPTGKAAQVLRDKGIRADTIHSVAYQYLGRTMDNELHFEFEGVPCNLLIVDEASMVNSEIHRDLIGSKARILYVGDYGQLPPVGDDPHIMEEMTAKLTHVHRQDDDLLDFAHCVREGGYWEFETPNVILQRKNTPPADQAMVDADIVICLKNHTRHRKNLQLFFEHKGVAAEQHQDALRQHWFARNFVGFFEQFLGQKIRCLCIKNNHKCGLWNGTLGDFEPEKVTAFGIAGTFTDDKGDDQAIEASVKGWGTNPGEVEWQNEDHDQVALDLGYCITAHKSQGSEWKSVVVIDETGPRTSNRDRWRYTAATRAREHITWIPMGKRNA